MTPQGELAEAAHGLPAALLCVACAAAVAGTCWPQQKPLKACWQWLGHTCGNPVLHVAFAGSCGQVVM